MASDYFSTNYSFYDFISCQKNKEKKKTNHNDKIMMRREKKKGLGILDKVLQYDILTQLSTKNVCFSQH
jgi:hypothetical protein